MPSKGLPIFEELLGPESIFGWIGRQPLRALPTEQEKAFAHSVGGAQITRGIYLPKSDFLLESGDRAFSSLKQAEVPIIRMPGGVNFYDHGNYLLSTVGLHRYPGMDVGGNANQMAVALANLGGGVLSYGKIVGNTGGIDFSDARTLAQIAAEKYAFEHRMGAPSLEDLPDRAAILDAPWKSNAFLDGKQIVYHPSNLIDEPREHLIPRGRDVALMTAEGERLADTDYKSWLDWMVWEGYINNELFRAPVDPSRVN